MNVRCLNLKYPVCFHRTDVRRMLWHAATIFCLVGSAVNLLAEQSTEYNRDVRPILAEQCFACHGADNAARKADLRLDQRDAAITSGAINLDDFQSSELLNRIFSEDADLIMPPAESKKQLSDHEKDTLKRWVMNGAEYQPHWSFIVPQRPVPPAVEKSNWIKNEIDRFVLAGLESKGLTPAPEADAYTLFRRLRLDTTGLPPMPEETADFVRDYKANSDLAVSEWIDKLMRSSAWGEHRARYWLDAARYADTHGMHFDNYREMWPYRDWVIRSFNANQPFDQFTIEQLAGDLLDKSTEQQRIATGFQRCNMTTNEGGTIDEENVAMYAADRVQTVGWVYLGLTTNCAQCHDHKFDPLTAKDYYSLAAYFRNTTQAAKDGNVKDGTGPFLIVPTPDDQGRWDALPSEIETAKTLRDRQRNEARGEFETWLAATTPSLIAKTVPTAGLLVHLPLNENTGNEVKNICASAETFRSTGEITWIPDGKLGPAPVMKPGATFDLGKLGDFEKDQSFSYGAWLKAGRGGNFGGMIARMDEKNSYRGWDLFQHDLKVAVHIVQTWPDNSLKVLTKRNVLALDQWQHVFATYDGSGKPEGIKIFVNGAEEPLDVENNTIKADATIRTETPLRLGQRSDKQEFADGAIQDFRLYARQLAPAEVLAIANLGSLQTAISASPRTPEQNAFLFDYYLSSEDTTYPQLAQRVTVLEVERESIRSRSPVTHVQEERKGMQPTASILMRGEYDRPGDQVLAAPPAALHPLPPGAPANRLGLAMWVVDPANPLTARVTVNRFWQEIFGRGIVSTAEDFGTMGALPSDQQLLDLLATEFVKSGWDVKNLFKRMLFSATYRQAAIITPQKLELDRDNILLSRGPRYRMDAEMLRDCALATSGLLSPKMYGPGTKPYQPGNIWDIVGLPEGNTRNYVQDRGENLYRRTIYDFWKRMAPPPSLELLNAPSREYCVVRRERTNTPLQALVMLNDPQFVEASRQLAQRVLSVASDSDSAMIEKLVERTLGRPATGRELEILLASKQELLEYYAAHPESAKSLNSVGESPGDERLDPAAIATLTMICNQLLNLDEALTK